MGLNKTLKKELGNIKKTKVIKKKSPKQYVIKTDKTKVLQVLEVLKNNKNLQFLQLVDLTAVDFPESKVRFDLVYLLLSHKLNKRVAVKFSLKDGEQAPSVAEIFPNANWPEREVFDMFGIEFENHSNLERILNEDEFEGFPLRKEFPQNGKKELFYNEEKQEFEYREIPQKDTESFDINIFFNKKEGGE